MCYFNTYYLTTDNFDKVKSVILLHEYFSITHINSIES